MGGVSTGVRSEPLRYTLVRQVLPKTKVAGSGAEGMRSKTPSRALSPTAGGVGARNGGKTCRAPTSGECVYVCVCVCVCVCV